MSEKSALDELFIKPESALLIDRATWGKLLSVLEQHKMQIELLKGEIARLKEASKT